jgi:CDP-glucose 4,6-dehydratase
MEGVEIELFGHAYRGRSVLITGHTDFKGSWLALWLKKLGAHAVGVGLSPDTSPNHWDMLHLGMPDHRCDIRDAAALFRVVADAKPEIVFHLALSPWLGVHTVTRWRHGPPT